MVLNLNGNRTFLDVKTHQACILLLFENQESMSYATIVEKTDIKDNMLNEYLKFMTTHAPNAIFKRQKGKDDPFSPDEIISFNTGFKSAQRRVILHSSKMNKALRDKDHDKDNDKAMKELEHERGFQIDALSVRVMKHRRVLKFNALIEEVIRMCTIFQPQITLIKKRLEALIEKGYFMRDEKDKATLIYVP